GRADAEQQPTARDDIDLSRHLRDHCRLPICVAQHDRSHADPRYNRCKSGERAPRFHYRAAFVARVRHEMIGDACDVPTCRLEMAPEVENRGPGLPGEACEDAETHD